MYEDASDAEVVKNIESTRDLLKLGPDADVIAQQIGVKERIYP